MEANEATSIIFEEAGVSANIIFGAVIDTDLNDEIRVTVIAMMKIQILIQTSMRFVTALITIVMKLLTLMQ